MAPGLHCKGQILKGLGHDVRVRILVRIRIISLDRDGVVFKLHHVHSFDHTYQLYGLM